MIKSVHAPLIYLSSKMFDETKTITSVFSLSNIVFTIHHVHMYYVVNLADRNYPSSSTKIQIYISLSYVSSLLS